MSNIRNEPCPCGSGKKYKKCCLDKENRSEHTGNTATVSDLFWHQQHKMRNDLVQKIFKYCVSTYGEASIQEAWDEFHLFYEEKVPMNFSSHEIQLFMPWFYYDWTPDFSKSELVDCEWTRDMSPTQSMLKKHRSRLSELEKKYIEVCLSSPFTFGEVTTCEPGQGFNLKDIFTGEELTVVEKSASKGVLHGDIFFCKPVTLNNLTTLEASSPIVIPPIHKKFILDLRKYIEKDSGKIDREVLFKYTPEMIDTYQRLYQLLMNPQMPKLCNTDGDDLVPQKLMFEMDNPMEVFQALKDLDIVSNEKEILEDAKINSDNNIEKITFTWAKEGNKKNKSWDNTLMGHILIEGKTLYAEVNSNERAALFKSIVKERLPQSARYKTTLITPVESMLKKNKHSTEGKLKDVSSKKNSGKTQKELHEENPELQGELNRMMTEHWRNWVNDKLPILGNITPKQAVKTKDGKEMLEAVLTQFERDVVDKPQPGITLQVFNDIRKQLGMEK